MDEPIPPRIEYVDTSAVAAFAADLPLEWLECRATTHHVVWVRDEIDGPNAYISVGQCQRCLVYETRQRISSISGELLGGSRGRYAEGPNGEKYTMPSGSGRLDKAARGRFRLEVRTRRLYQAPKSQRKRSW